MRRHPVRFRSIHADRPALATVLCGALGTLGLCTVDSTTLGVTAFARPDPSSETAPE